MFLGAPQFKFNNLGLALGMAKWLNLEARKFWGTIPKFLKVTGEKLTVGVFFHPRPILNCVKETSAWQKWNCSFERFFSVDVGNLLKSSEVPVLEVDS